jgi:hypothetical protein
VAATTQTQHILSHKSPLRVCPFGEVGWGFKPFTMKNLFFLTLCVIAIFSVVACHKDADTTDLVDTTVKGRILQVYSTTPVPNATVYLYETVFSSNGTLGGSANTVSLDTVVTNDKGEYAFDYKRKRGGNEYFIRAFAKNFDDKPGNFYVTGKNATMDVPIFPYAWIGFRIINAPPSGNSDGITITGYLRDFAPLDYISLNGKADISIVKKVIGNQKTPISIYIENEKGVNKYIDSVYCKGLDTTYHTITY